MLIGAFVFAKARRAESGVWPTVAAAVALVSTPWFIWAIINVSAPYVFEAPTHHCAYCLLRSAEGGWLGVLLWALTILLAVCASSWFAATLAARGVLEHSKRREWILITLAFANARTSIVFNLAIFFVLLPVAIYRIKTGHFLSL